MSNKQKWLKPDGSVDEPAVDKFIQEAQSKLPVVGEAPITIDELGAFCSKRNLQGAVIITVSRDGTVSVVSYGESKKKCNVLGKWAKGLWNTAISAVPFSTVFGFGNGGVPKPVDLSGVDDATKDKVRQYEEYLIRD